MSALEWDDAAETAFEAARDQELHDRRGAGQRLTASWVRPAASSPAPAGCAAARCPARAGLACRRSNDCGGRA